MVSHSIQIGLLGNFGGMLKIISKEQILVILLREFKFGRNAMEAHENIVKAWGADAFPLSSSSGS